MRRSTLSGTVLAIAVAIVLVTPAAGWARVEVASLGGTACCFYLGLRVTVGVDEGYLRGAIELAGYELACLTLGPTDAVRWGVPIVAIVTELRNARTDRLASSRGKTTAR